MTETNETLFNCCPDNRAPDWNLYDDFEIEAVNMDSDGSCTPCFDTGAPVTFWTVYAHLKEGGVHAISDVSTERLARAVESRLRKISGIKGI